MADSAESAARHKRIADVEQETEDRMHSTAERLPEPQRSAVHRRAKAVSHRAEEHRETARRLQQDSDEPGTS